ncbi:4Fe-4S binding protein [Pontiellaceae bacterium B12227]|nr:4Fe-4S binding protein [Pontiellaceae bacterium B12227]
MRLAELYEKLETIGVLTFSTIHNNEVHSRSAHFNGFDEDGLYFRTMANKPYCRQLLETGKLTVCGISDARVWHDGASAKFPPSFTIRLIGEVRRVPPEEIIDKAKTNDALKTAAEDIVNYPAMAEGNFVMHSAKVEIFDVDFEKEMRGNKVYRTRFAFGGASYNPAGVRITDACIECGACKEVCSFQAIEEGTPYRCIPEYCDDCGSCLRVCPVNAIQESLVF